MEIRYRDIFFLLIRDSTYFRKAFREKKRDAYIHTRLGIYDNQYSFLNIANNNTWIFLIAFIWRYITENFSCMCMWRKESFRAHAQTWYSILRPFLSPRVLLHRLVSASRVPSRFRYDCRRARVCVCAADAYICIYAHTIPRAVGGMQISQRET